MVVLTERLKEEVERQEVIQEGQVGFRKIEGDNRQYLCHELSDGKQLGKKGEDSGPVHEFESCFRFNE